MKGSSIMLKCFAALLLSIACLFAQAKVSPEREAAMKADLTGQIDSMKKQAQVMVDSVFSFGELGFQEFETSKYLTGILEKEGFKVERGIAGIPKPRFWPHGAPASRSSRWVPISTIFRRHRRSRAWRITI